MKFYDSAFDRDQERISYYYLAYYELAKKKKKIY